MSDAAPAEDWWTPAQRALVADRSLPWTRRRWRVRDAWVAPDGTRCPFEAWADPATRPAGLRLEPGGWDHDHCEPCWAKLPHDEPEGFTDGAHRWLCPACHARYIAPREASTGS